MSQGRLDVFRVFEDLFEAEICNSRNLEVEDIGRVLSNASCDEAKGDI